MISTDQVNTLLNNGGTVVGNDGSKIGKVEQVYLDDQTGNPEWVTVKTGLFGSAETFIPLSQGNVSGDEIRVPFTKDTVKDAPRVSDAEGHLSPEEEAELYRYYGMDYSGAASDTGGDYSRTTGDAGLATEDVTGRQGAGYDADARGTVGHDTSGPTTDDAMTRSEEQLHVGTERVEAGRARLRKYIVTENVTRTVPVQREEVRLEREPITDANRGDALSGPDLSEEEHEVVLSEERVVVDKETVPVERVRLDKDVVTDNEQVDETVRKEEIETDTSAVDNDRRTL
ncbi:PRC and DUF2382 domain-containing protein [Georgenia sp. MJ206]|uniref:PRC and DUF2382 domain-containing protein n=1 Tax=Georgenia wangjunii TaxID=3117730 RepID=UPI002F263D6E